MAYLEFPELVYSDGQSCFGIEIGYDLLPQARKEDWILKLAAETQRWVKAKNFEKRGTLWAHTGPTLNFATSGPIWAEWVVWFGLPKSFLRYLHDQAKASLPGCVRYSESVQFLRYDWKAIVHVEKNAAWTEVDGDTWDRVKLKARP